MEKKQIFTNISQFELKELISESIQSELRKIGSIENQKEGLIKAKEACDYLHVSKPTLYKWMKERRFNGYYLGSRLYFKKSELEKAATKTTSREK